MLAKNEQSGLHGQIGPVRTPVVTHLFLPFAANMVTLGIQVEFCISRSIVNQRPHSAPHGKTLVPRVQKPVLQEDSQKRFKPLLNGREEESART